VFLRKARGDHPLARRLDEFKLRMPVTGNLLDKGVNARIAATLGNLLTAGVPLLDALDHAANVAASQPYAEALRGVRDRVGDGATLADALADAELFPELLVQLASVGEESGALPDLMARYADTAEQEMAQAADTLISMIEPLMMVGIGGVVGVFLIGLYLPVISLVDQIK
jgi:type IV pilus assembly protein PilC